MVATSSHPGLEPASGRGGGIEPVKGCSRGLAVAKSPVRRQAAGPGPEGSPIPAARAGFTMVEVIVAVVILAVGLLGMAGTTALVVRQVTLSDVATERMAALQTTIERLEATPFDSITNGTDSVGIYKVDWTVTKPSAQWAVVEIVTTGPGLGTSDSGFPMLTRSVTDTFTFRILR